jgi:CheY-like chemotaxis protein
MDGWEVLKRLRTTTRRASSRSSSSPWSTTAISASPSARTTIREARRSHACSIAEEITARRGKRLLVIDDDVTIHTILDEDLAALGYAIDKAFCGEDGLRFAEERMPDVIILDLMMPGIAGSGGERSDRTRARRTSILILTSKEVSTDDRAAAHAGSSFVQRTSAKDQLVREISALPQLLNTFRVIARISVSASAVTSRFDAFVKIASAMCSPFGSVISATSFVVPGIVPVLCATVAPGGTAALMRFAPVVVLVDAHEDAWLVGESPSRLFQNATSGCAMASRSRCRARRSRNVRDRPSPRAAAISRSSDRCGSR